MSIHFILLTIHRSKLAMFVKSRYFQIFLIALVCVHFICPLFCATYGQKMCSDRQFAHTETDVPCCNKVHSDTTNGSKVPSDSGIACCLTDLELILPPDMNDIETVRESVVQHPISKVLLSTILTVPQEQLFNLPGPPKLPEVSLNTVISHRGPPLNLS